MSDRTLAVDPFTTLKRCEEHAAHVEAMAVECWGEWRPLRDALAALTSVPSADPLWVSRLLAAGPALGDAGLAGFVAEMASGTVLDTPEPEIVAERAAWALLAAAVEGDGTRAGELLLDVRRYPAVYAALPEAIDGVMDACLRRWWEVASPGYVRRLLLNGTYTPADLHTLLGENSPVKLSDGARAALRRWLAWANPTEEDEPDDGELDVRVPADDDDRHVRTAGAGSFADLRDTANTILLKGKQATIIGALCDGGGIVPLADLAVICDWNTPCDDIWNSTRIKLDKKLKRRGFSLATHDRQAVVKRLRPGAPK